MVKNPPAKWETELQSLGQEDTLEKEMATHSSILAWEIHGQRNLADYSPWGYKESDTTEVTEHACVPDLHMEVKGDKSEIPQILN